jgi:para-aminobenzoate synthetase component 1
VSVAVNVDASARGGFKVLALSERPWIDPVAAAARLADRPWTALLHSDGGPKARWSYLCADPVRAWTDRGETANGEAVLSRVRERVGLPSPVSPANGGVQIASENRSAGAPNGASTQSSASGPRRSPGNRTLEIPPFTGGAVGLLAYEFGARLETLDLPRDPDWPDAAVAIYPAVLAFDHHERRCVAVGRGADPTESRRRAEQAGAWAGAGEVPEPEPSDDWTPLAPVEAYEAAVADVVARIGAGELFQANVARGWGGTLGRPDAAFAAFAALARRRSAPFGAWLRLPGLALVSNSPERFVEVRGERVETRPIKGTRPRGGSAAEDATQAAELLASLKDRAENLMIVDLMRNDLARVCRPGSVEVADLFALETYANVHHLVSTVRGRLAEGRDALDVLASTFPPGSITGAPKLQAMRVVSAHEPPRGPYCGSLFRLGFDGSLDSSVLIRTAAFVERSGGGWRYTARAGAGITADSDPASERAETEAKASALRAALTGEGA